MEKKKSIDKKRPERIKLRDANNKKEAERAILLNTVKGAIALHKRDTRAKAAQARAANSRPLSEKVDIVEQEPQPTTSYLRNIEILTQRVLQRTDPISQTEFKNLDFEIYEVESLLGQRQERENVVYLVRWEKTGLAYQCHKGNGVIPWLNLFAGKRISLGEALMEELKNPEFDFSLSADSLLVVKPV